MKILLTGADGFIGKRVSDALVKNGHSVFGYDLPDYDITDEEQFKNVIRTFDPGTIIHCAAMADVTKCIVMMDETFECNIRGTYNIAKHCAINDKHMIFISTCCVYGNSLDDLEIEHKTAPQAAEPYAVSKIAGEAIIRGMPNLSYCMLRIGTVHGPGMREALFTYIALDRVKNGKLIYIDGDGEQTRQLVYIDDLVDGIVRATEKGRDLNGQIINLCGKEKTSALETVLVAEKVVGKAANIQHREQRYGQTFEENISIAHARKLLGWDPKTSFFDGMKKAYELDPRFK